jgi:hypothetical protein
LLRSGVFIMKRTSGFVRAGLLAVGSVVAGCGGAVGSVDGAPPPSTAGGTQGQGCATASRIAIAAGEVVETLSVANGQITWGAVESDGSGTVWTASTCEGAVPTRIASGRGHPSSLVVDGGRAAWIEDLSSVHSVPLTGGDVATVAQYSLVSPGDSVVEYLAAYGGSLYWTGLHGDCPSPTTCTGFIPFVAVAQATGIGGPEELFTGSPANSWSNLLVDARGIVVVQEVAAPPAAPDALLLRIPLAGGAPATLDTEAPATFRGDALAACGADVCWFGSDTSSPEALSFVRVPDGAPPMRATLPAAPNPDQDVFLAMDEDRVYFLEANFDTFGSPNPSVLSETSAGGDRRPLVTSGIGPRASAIAFDAQHVYVPASDGIYVVAK